MRFRQPELPREQGLLIPRRLDDVVPDGHRVRCVVALLEAPAFRETFRNLEAKYSASDRGQPPFNPWYLVALYIYGMLIRIRSSRRLEDACKHRTDVMWLMEGQTPDHSTISSFIKHNGEFLHDLLTDTILVGLKAKLISLKHVSVDGTKLEADAGLDSLKTREAIEEEIKRREEEFAANEAKENSLIDDKEDEASPTERMERLKRALEVLERRENEASGNNKVAPVASTTDPDARRMKDKKGVSGPNYNAQLTADFDSRMIVGSDVTDQPDDSGELIPQLEQTEENCGRVPEEVSADSAYNTGPALNYCQDHGTTPYMPDSGEREPVLPEKTQEAIDAVGANETLTEEQIEELPLDRNGRLDRRAFSYDETTDTYRCPMGAILERGRTSTDKQKCGTARRTQYRASADACGSCPLAKKCCQKEGVPRMVTHDQYEPLRRELRARMQTEEGKRAYRKRAPASETPIAVCKNILGIRRFMRRGLRAVKAEWAGICAVMNIRQLIKHWAVVEPTVGA